MMDSVGKKLNLQERGARYDHYMELREIFMDGIDVISRMNPNFVNDHDKGVKIKLQNAVEMITRRIDNLSDFADKTANYGDLARQVRLAGKHVTPLLMEGSHVEPIKPETNPDQPGDTETAGDTPFDSQ
jgi:hypothetical protein